MIFHSKIEITLAIQKTFFTVHSTDFDFYYIRGITNGNCSKCTLIIVTKFLLSMIIPLYANGIEA